MTMENLHIMPIKEEFKLAKRVYNNINSLKDLRHAIKINKDIQDKLNHQRFEININKKHYQIHSEFNTKDLL